jgi:hypothetical protein
MIEMIEDSFNRIDSLPEDDQVEDNFSIKEVHITKRLSSKVIVELLDNYPALKRITCPISVYNRISKRYIDVLSDIGVSVDVGYNYNHPKKYLHDVGLKVVDLIQEGKKPLEVANILDLPVERVYYLRSRFSNPKIKLKTGKKTKYTEKQINDIKVQRERGVPVKKIAEVENIPLRTVYYIIKNYIE